MLGTVFIGPSGLLDALQQRNDLGDTLAFTSADAPRALHAIRRQHPQLVVIEGGFAETQHGRALIRRIRADPTLATCEVRIVGHDGEVIPVPPPRSGRTQGDPAARSARPAGALVASPAAAQADPAGSPTTPPAGAAPGQASRRRAPRFKVVDGTEVHIDGKPVSLVDMSLVGAEVWSPAPLRPSQRIRLTLPDEVHPVHVRATVVWVSFEMSKGVPGYRAGIQFFVAREDWVSGFIEAYRLEPRNRK